MSCRRRRGPTRPQSGAAARKRRGQKAPRPTAAVKQGRGQTRPWSNKAAAAANRPSCLPAVAQHRPVKNRPTAAANRRGQTTHAAAKQGRGQKTLNRRRDPISPGQEPPKRAVKQNPRPSTAAAKHRRAQASPKRGGQAKRRGPVQRRGPTGQTARPNWSNSAAQLVKQRGPTGQTARPNQARRSNKCRGRVQLVKQRRGQPPGQAAEDRARLHHARRPHGGPAREAEVQSKRSG